MEEEGGKVRNCYYDAFDAIVAALDALAKTLTVDAGDDGTPVEELPVRDQNSYFESFRAIAQALVRVREAAAGRLAGAAAGGSSAAAFARPAAEGGVVRLEDNAVNDVALDGTRVSFAFPAAGGRARAFMLRLTMGAETEWSLPGGVAFECDDDTVFDGVETGATAVFIFSETAPGRFLVSRKDARTVKKE